MGTLHRMGPRERRGTAVIALALALGTLAVTPSGAAALDPAASEVVQPVTREGQTLTMRMVKAPLRGPEFEVRIQRAGGGYADVAAGGERAFLGTVDERPGAVASGIVGRDGRFRGAIYFDRGGTWFTLGDTVTGVRGLDAQEFAWPTKPNLAAGRSGGEMRAWDLAVDADSDYYAQRGSSAEATLEQIEYGIAVTRTIYMRDALLMPRLARVVIRSSRADDPYVGDARLGALRDEWRANQPGAERDEALLVEGSGSGGVAYRTNFNPDFAYAVADADDDGSFDVVARHEIGHNFDISDNHASGPEGRTLLEGNALARFNGPELQTLFDSRNARAGAFTALGRYTATSLPPYAGLDLVEGGSGTVDVLANDHDANGDELRLVSVEERTAAGGSAAIENGRVAYRAPAGGGRDSFRYVIADACGHTATGVVFARTNGDGGTVPSTAPDPTGPAGGRTACPVDRPAAPSTPIATAPRDAAGCFVETAPGYVHPAKLRVSRGRVLRSDRRLDVLAPITARAGGGVGVKYVGGGRTDRFSDRVTASRGKLDSVRIRRKLTSRQARLGTGIFTLTYPG